MKLCIADPPYLGRGAMLYGADAVSFPAGKGMGYAVTSRLQAGDRHPDAATWDDPTTHRQMVERLCADYDGWAIAMNPENLHDYLAWVPRETRICAWVKPDAFPAGRIVRSWEPVLVRVPDDRRTRGLEQRRDSIVCNKRPPGPRVAMIGSKPPTWTRWVLDMLGYDPETDTVDDLFHGSGAVAAEIAQGVLPFDGGAEVTE